MNKHRQILEVLGSSGNALDPRDFKLYVHNVAVEDRTWAAAQELNPGGTLQILMHISRPKIVLHKTSLSDPQMEDTDDESSSMSQSRFKLHRLNPTPVIEPFLKWNVLDKYGVREMGSAVSRMDCFLWKIYEALPAESDFNGSERWSFKKTYAASTKISVKGRGVSEVRDDAFRFSGRELFEEAYRLWHFFVSQDATASAPVQLYWGLLYELQREWLPAHPDCSEILDLLGEINAFADRIHLGVHFRASEIDPDKPMRKDDRDMISASSILLSSIVDTLIAVHQMLISAVGVTRANSKSHSVLRKSYMNDVVTYGSEAKSLMRTARDELIAEANITFYTATASVMPSPDGLVVILMERLVRGVFE